jgi:transcriptional regulator with XRE-family HTH domain
MDDTHQLQISAALRSAVARDDAGMVIRLARRAADLTQTGLGRLCGYSASTVSRIERNQPPVHDIDVRRRIATVLGIPPQHLGLVSSADQRHGTPTPHLIAPPRPDNDAKVSWTSTGERGEAPVRRREILTGLAGSAAAGLLPASAHATAPSPTTGHLEALLTADAATAAPVTLAELATAMADAMIAFSDCRYEHLAGALPGLLATAHSSCDAATGGRQDRLAVLLADGYSLASELCIKLNDDAIGWVLADRALATARDSGSASSIAAATRQFAIAMRRAGHHDGAVSLLTSTAGDLGANGDNATAAQIAAYGPLLCTAAYSSAQHGRQSQAIELIDEATLAAARLSQPGPNTTEGFSPSNVTIYKIGIYTALGNSATALDHARSVDPRLLPNRERHARYCVDTARAWVSHGDLEHAYQALCAAERHAPEEVRRPSIRDLVSTMLYAPSPTPRGLRDLASRICAV